MGALTTGTRSPSALDHGVPRPVNVGPNRWSDGSSSRALRPMMTAVEDGAAFGAHQARPTRRIATVRRPRRDRIHPGGVGSRSGSVLGAIDGEEVDGQTYRPAEFDVVLDPGRNPLRSEGAHHDVDGRLTGAGEAQLSLADPEPSPRPLTDPVRPEQCRRDRVLIPLRARTEEPETVRSLRSFARAARQGGTDSRPAASLLQYPLPHLEGRTVSDVLMVTTTELGDPVAHRVDVESGDRTFHPSHPPFLGRHDPTGWEAGRCRCGALGGPSCIRRGLRRSKRM